MPAAIASSPRSCGDWRGKEGRAVHAFVPLKFELGEAFQFDWSEEGLVVGGIYRRMQVSHSNYAPVGRSGWSPILVRAMKCSLMLTLAHSLRWAAFPVAASTTT